MTNNFVFEPDLSAKKIYVAREFNASIEKVWRAFTEAELLVKWIAPKPWTAEPKTWDFTVGGVGLYAMVGPEGAKHWVYAEFTAIEKQVAFSTIGMFCDAEGNPVKSGPKSHRDTKFLAIGSNRTKVESMITFEDEATLKWFAEGGFKEGTIDTFSQLDKLLEEEK